MENQIFTPEECQFLKDRNADLDQPVFPLSCFVAYMLKDTKDLINKTKSDTSTKFDTPQQYRKKLEKNYTAQAFNSLKGLKIIIAVLLSGRISLVSFNPIINLLSGDNPSLEARAGATFKTLCLSVVLFFVLCFVISLLITLVQGKLSALLHKSDIDNEVKSYADDYEDFCNDLKCRVDYLSDAQEDLAMYQKCMSKLSNHRDCLPTKYWDDAYDFYEICFNRLVDTPAAAIQAFETLQHQRRMEDQQRQQTEYAYQANQTAQEALKKAANAESAAFWAEAAANRAADQTNRY